MVSERPKKRGEEQALIYEEHPANVAAVVTQSRMQGEIPGVLGAAVSVWEATRAALAKTARRS